jgi:hypothetical protein
MIFLGLKYQNVVSRGPFKDKDVEVIGSFGPQEAAHEVTIPRREWDITPDGNLFHFISVLFSFFCLECLFLSGFYCCLIHFVIVRNVNAWILYWRNQID